MDLRPVLLVPVLALVLTGCAQAQDVVDSAQAGSEKVKDCTGLAQDVFGVGLNKTPTPAEAKQLKENLDKRVDGIDDADVKAAAAGLRDKVTELSAALQSADQAKIQSAFTQARSAAQATAKACSLPTSSFLK